MYNFEDFTEDNYKLILEKIKDRYDFIAYTDIETYKNQKEFLLWRHDVDFSLHRAWVLAKIEKSLGIKSTYFLQLSSELYNLFEKEIKELVFKIKSLEHNIGLHFDPTLYSIRTKEDLEKHLTFEKEIIENLFDINIKVFSFHNPTEEILKNDSFKYAGMINTYAKEFKDTIAYCSDSNGYWRHERLEDFLLKDDKANRHVLTHPGWWQKIVMTPNERFTRCVEGRSEKRFKSYDENLQLLGRLNVK